MSRLLWPRMTIAALVLALSASLAAPCLAAAPASPKDEPCSMAGHAGRGGAFAEACCLADEAQRNDREAQPVSRLAAAKTAQVLATTPAAATTDTPTLIGAPPIDTTSLLASNDRTARSSPLRI